MVSTSASAQGKLMPPSGWVPRSARDLFDALPELTGFRTEVVEGNLIVSPLGTPEHGARAANLHDVLHPVRDKHRWQGWVMGVDVVIEGSREPVEPDYVLASPDCPRWGTRELRSSGLILVAEVVSRGSALIDRVDKPRLYAAGEVPIYLLIDPVADPQAVTVYSGIHDGVYRTISTVAMGTSLRLPAPVDYEIDTSIFAV
jgi:hypothetical protein